MDKGEKQKRVEEQARCGILDFYMMEHSPGVIIDARLRGNLARLINSSCDPNCITQKWRDAGTDEVATPGVIGGSMI
jgi:SET domain-containing protein